MHRHNPSQIPSKNALLKTIAIIAVVMSCALISRNAPIHAQQSQAPDDEGAALFRLACASSYCHGENGKGGGGPVLLGRTFSQERLRRVIAEGMPGTAMPSFKTRFSPAEIAEVITFVRSLSTSSGTNLTPATPIPATSTPTTPAATPGAEVYPTGPLSEVELGRLLFFDATIMSNCRICHTFEGKGGKVGPDLSKVGSKSEIGLERSITHPNEEITPGFELLALTTRDGATFVGVKRDENAERIRLFDKSTTPPISRAIEKSEIVLREVRSGSAMPQNFGTRFSQAQLKALVAFLKSSDFR